MPIPPVIKPVLLPEFALPERVLFPNGTTMYTLHDERQDVVRADFLFSGGYSVQSRPLQALFTNRMLREGADGYTAEEISRRLDYYGAWIDMYSSQNCNHITLYTLTKHLQPLLEMLEIVVEHPLFPDGNLATVRRNNKAYYSVNSHKVDVLAQRHFENLLWGPKHPLGHIVTAEDYDAIERDILLDYHSLCYGSNNLTIFLSGNISESTMTVMEKHFGRRKWGCSGTPRAALAAPVPTIGRRTVKADGAMQSAIKIGRMVMDASHPDFPGFRFLTVLFGGYFGSRLMSNVRERNGYTYHIEAELDAYGAGNALMISSETDNAFLEPLLLEVYREMERLRDELVTDDELNLVRNYTLGSLCREYEGAISKAEAFLNLWLSGENFASINNYIDVVRNITAVELKELACKYLTPRLMSEVVVGA